MWCKLIFFTTLALSPSYYVCGGGLFARLDLFTGMRLENHVNWLTSDHAVRDAALSFRTIAEVRPRFASTLPLFETVQAMSTSDAASLVCTPVYCNVNHYCMVQQLCISVLVVGPYIMQLGIICRNHHHRRHRCHRRYRRYRRHRRHRCHRRHRRHCRCHSCCCHSCRRHRHCHRHIFK